MFARTHAGKIRSQISGVHDADRPGHRRDLHLDRDLHARKLAVHPQRQLFQLRHVYTVRSIITLTVDWPYATLTVD